MKIFTVGVLASAGAIITPNIPLNIQNTNPAIYEAASESAHPTPKATQTPDNHSQKEESKESPLPLTGENYIYVQGNYSYFGQSVKYLFIIPRNGGSFSGTVQGSCNAQAGGNYEGGNGGKFVGNVSGTCSMFGTKIQGSTGFNGRLYPETKTVKLDIDNSPIHGFTVNYN